MPSLSKLHTNAALVVGCMLYQQGHVCSSVTPLLVYFVGVCAAVVVVFEQ